MMKFTQKSFLRYKIFVAIVSLNVLFMVSIAAFNFYQDSVKINSSKKQELVDIHQKIQETLSYLLLQNSHKNQLSEIKNILGERLFELANIHNVSVTVYSLSGEILVSSKYKNKALRPSFLKELMLKKKKLSEESLDDDTDLYTSYGYLYKGNVPTAIIGAETTSDKKSLFYHLLVLTKQFLLLIIFLIVISGYIAWFISKNLTKKIEQIAFSLRKTNVAYLETPIYYPEEDEIKPLVDSYNNMLVKLKEQTHILTKMEREDAWREMAKQIAHEINNPLTPLKLAVQNFQRKYNPEDPKNEEKITNLTQVVVNQIDIIASITRAFSDFAHMPVTNDKLIEVVESVRKAVEIFPENMVSFSCNVREIYYKIDHVYLSRMVTNLVKNAIQSIPHDPKKVEVQLEDSIDKFIISIKDNGSGIHEENKDRLFEKQFTTKTDGKGLGLYMVKKIVEDYGGSIWFESEKDNGTTFFIKFVKTIKKT